MREQPYGFGLQVRCFWTSGSSSVSGCRPTDFQEIRSTRNCKIYSPHLSPAFAGSHLGFTWAVCGIETIGAKHQNFVAG